MVKKTIRKKLIEEQQKRQNRLIENKLVESRLAIIVESSEKFQSLSPKKPFFVFSAISFSSFS